jgi:hypothetical protein
MGSGKLFTPFALTSRMRLSHKRRPFAVRTLHDEGGMSYAPLKKMLGVSRLRVAWLADFAR